MTELGIYLDKALWTDSSHNSMMDECVCMCCVCLCWQFLFSSLAICFLFFSYWKGTICRALYIIFWENRHTLSHSPFRTLKIYNWLIDILTKKWAHALLKVLSARSMSGHVAENICTLMLMNTERMYSVHIQYLPQLLCLTKKEKRRRRNGRRRRNNKERLKLFAGMFVSRYWWLLLSKCELNWYKLQHCSPQILHFHGLLSLWQPLWRKYNVWSGNVILQWVHWRPLVRGSGLVEVGGSPLEWGLEFAPLLLMLLLLLLLLLFVELVESLRRRSSRSSDLSGDTLIKDGNGRLLDVAPVSSMPLLFGSCLMGIKEIDGVMASSPPLTFLRKIQILA